MTKKEEIARNHLKLQNMGYTIVKQADKCCTIYDNNGVEVDHYYDTPAIDSEYATLRRVVGDILYQQDLAASTPTLPPKPYRRPDPRSIYD